MTIQNPGNGAPGSGDGGGGAAPPPSVPATPTTPKFEQKEGKMYLDGKELSLTSDLIAAKESLKTQATEAQAVHTEAIDKAKLGLSEAQQQLAAANAKIQTLEQAQGTGAASAEEAARVKEELTTTKGSLETLSTRALEFRKQALIATFKVPAEKLANKTMEQLDSFEEALKALGATGGPGAYAIGGAGGGSGKPLTDFERALAVVESTPVTGVRSEPPESK